MPEKQSEKGKKRKANNNKNENTIFGLSQSHSVEFLCFLLLNFILYVFVCTAELFGSFCMARTLGHLFMCRQTHLIYLDECELICVELVFFFFGPKLHVCSLVIYLVYSIYFWLFDAMPANRNWHSYKEYKTTHKPTNDVQTERKKTGEIKIKITRKISIYQNGSR